MSHRQRRRTRRDEPLPEEFITILCGLGLIFVFLLAML